jgi:transketolase N-terminal domain/subunit
MNILHERIFEISKKHHLSHIGSNLTAVNIIDDIYQKKEEEEPFILSCGHAGLALYVVLEKYYGFDAEQLFLKHGTHPHRDLGDKIHCSTGSLGMGIGVAVGMALANRSKNVYCLISDGEAFEGAIWEAANVIHRYNITNLKITCNWNWYSAYALVEGWMMSNLIKIIPGIDIHIDKVEQYGLTGLSAHYITL